METIEIKVSEYYDDSKYSAFMPEIVFDEMQREFEKCARQSV
jgi:hypothetical protein